MGSCVSAPSSANEDLEGQKNYPSCFRARRCRRKGSSMSVDGLKSLCADEDNIVSEKRISSNGSSDIASVFTLQGRKGINQDAMIVWEDFLSQGTVFCGVFDGHGPYGHVVARTVRDALPVKLHTFWNALKNGSRKSVPRFPGEKRRAKKQTDFLGSENSGEESGMFSVWKEAYLKAYKVMDKELKHHQHVDCFCSGSTAVSIVKQGDYLLIGNVGDSRAVLATKSDDDSLIAVQLTVDLKPDLPREAERIRKCRGRVFALQDEPEVQRVWLPYDDAPGLAMARAFGDFCLKDYGVIATPEVSSRLLTERDQFVVLASDGVWDVLSNEEVVEIVSSASSRSVAASAVVEAAVREWTIQYPTSKMDDCAVVCLFLNKLPEESQIRSLTKLEKQPMDISAKQRVQSREEEGPLLQRIHTVRNVESTESIVVLEPSIDFKHSSGEIDFEPHNSISAFDQNWSGLEGVTRVNSLVQLPRFPERTSKRLKPTLL